MGDMNISPSDLDIGIGDEIVNVGYAQVNVLSYQKKRVVSTFVRLRIRRQFP